jgi:hypothetical protein
LNQWMKAVTLPESRISSSMCLSSTPNDFTLRISPVSKGLTRHISIL